ncbi:hypothetical protein HPP92_026497 [Vanilla planifolia]|uniref:Uncharacterized protein n=1 Tax=Vanilla planifolia TaxID=51239 RepID=A0A835PC93_VANPL|nr:hypothetical protein HPP92_026497 [Vanilla planifolia]
MEGIVQHGLEEKQSGEGEGEVPGCEGFGAGRGNELDGCAVVGDVVGSYVRRDFSGSRRFIIGKVVSLDASSGIYRVMYEDGHQEDLEQGQVSKIVMLNEDGGRLTRRKRRLDQLVPFGGYKRPNTRSQIGDHDEPVSVGQPTKEQIDDSSSDSYNQAVVPAATSDSSSSETLNLPLELPPSSGSISIPEDSVSYLFSTYNFLRSFSLQLFLSPFRLDDFVGALNCTVQNSLMDSIYLSLMRALSRHLQMLSLEGSELASRCLRHYDWTLLDVLTWPAFLIEYLHVMGYMKEIHSKEFINGILDAEYYSLPVPIKLRLLQLLCDDVVNSAELRTEIAARANIEGADEYDVDVDLPLDSGNNSHYKSSLGLALKDGGISGKVVTENVLIHSKCSEAVADSLDNEHDENSDECCLCGMDGTLVCCDGCPSAYHSRCIGLSKAFLPDGSWFCPECNINKLEPTSLRKGTGTRGAEIFGMDVNGCMFLATCNYLLVLGTALGGERVSRYYNRDDIPKVLGVLTSTTQNTFAYADISRAISEYWDVPMVSLKAESIRNSLFCEDSSMCNFSLVSGSPRVDIDVSNCSGQSNFSSFILDISKHSSTIDDRNKTSNVSSVVVQGEMADLHINSGAMNDLCVNKLPGTSELVPLNDRTESGSDNPMDGNIPSTNMSMSEQFAFDSVFADASCSNQPLPAEAEDCSVYSVKDYSAGTSYESKYQSQKYDNTYKNTCTSQSTVPVTFKPQAYQNQYIQGDIAASAAASLAVLSSEDVKVSDANLSSNLRKRIADNIALQIKAFSVAVMNFLWPSFDKKQTDVPRERCGWCIACKGPTTNKKGCLLNLAASNAIKGPARNLSLRSSIHHESHLPVVAAQILIMEESLRGLMVGPFLDVQYCKQWSKQVREAFSFRVLKTLLIELEKNIRGVSFSGEWTKLVDEMVQKSVSSNVGRTGQSQKRMHSGRRSKKHSEVVVTSFDDSNGNIVNWWRGGKLSRAIVQICTLPSSLAKKAARQGGIKRIYGISYPISSENPRRTRQFSWRAAVEMSRSTSQLALQVRYLDSHIRWKDFARPEIQTDSKGSENEAMFFRNASISDKKTDQNKIAYALTFGGQKHIPLRITKNVLESENTLDGIRKLWFSEYHVPLYLIKEYEEKVAKDMVPLSYKLKHLRKFQRKQLKVYWGDIFSYLSYKGDKPSKCSSCEKDVSLRYVSKCKACQGFCHLECSVPLNLKEEDVLNINAMCKPCYFANTSVVKNPSITDSSRQLCGRQQYSQGHCLGMSQAGPFSTSSSLSEVDNNLESGSQTPVPHTESKPKSSGGSVSYGIVWRRKKDGIDAGEEFRMENILYKGENGASPQKEPICRLCQMPYSPDLMYVCCQRCRSWFHADALLLEEARVVDVIGFKCAKCRRKLSPVCPYSQPDYKKSQKTSNRDDPIETNGVFASFF